MADETFAIGLALDTQSAIGTVNSTVAALSGSIGSSDGCVLGDKGSGDAESGITIPNLEQFVREVAQVSGSFTAQADAFLRTLVNGFQVSIPMQGNGATATTPASGEALPLNGIDALWQSAGLSGANGTAPIYVYTPRATAVYLTAKLWIGDLSFVFQDVIPNSVTIAHEAGGSGIATFDLAVGSLNAFSDGVTFPTINYTTQATLANPSIVGVSHSWGQSRGFENLSVTITNSIETFGDSNVAATGTRQSQTSRVVTVDGRMYIATADSDFEYQQLVSTTAPTSDLSFQVGTVAGASDVINAYKIECNNLQPKSIKYDRTGTAMVVELSGAKCTATSAGGEFTLTYN